MPSGSTMDMLCCTPSGLGAAVEPTSNPAYLSHPEEFEKVWSAVIRSFQLPMYAAKF
jgi:hypothetical protein